MDNLIINTPEEARAIVAERNARIAYSQHKQREARRRIELHQDQMDLVNAHKEVWE